MIDLFYYVPKFNSDVSLSDTRAVTDVSYLLLRSDLFSSYYVPHEFLLLWLHLSIPIIVDDERYMTIII